MKKKRGLKMLLPENCKKDGFNLILDWPVRRKTTAWPEGWMGQGRQMISNKWRPFSSVTCQLQTACKLHYVLTHRRNSIMKWQKQKQKQTRKYSMSNQNTANFENSFILYRVELINNVVSFRCTAAWFSYTCIYTFSNSFPI